MLKDKELVELEKKRQEDSDWILERIGLIEKLRRYGEVNIVGAKALGLMIAKDIDISVVAKQVNVKDWKRLVGELMTTPHVRKVTAIDYYNYDEKNQYIPNKGMKYSLYVSMDKLIGQDGDCFDTWECQIHLQEKDVFDSSKIEDIKKKLTPKKRINILKLKYWADKVNKFIYPRTGGNFKIQSPVIYCAVLDNGIADIGDFAESFQSQIPKEYLNIFNEALNNIKG